MYKDQRMAVFWVFLLLWTLPLTGCATDRSASSGDKLTTTDMDARENSRKLDKLSGSFDGLAATIESFQADMRYLREEMDKLKNRVDGLEGGKSPSRKPGRYQEGDIVPTPPPPMEKLEEKSGRLEKTPPPESGITVASLSPEDYYQNAYDDLRFGEYNGAIENFRKFVDTYPDNGLADNAQYWIGESYYALKDFKKAAEEFKKVFEIYPKGNKVPDAKLKYALCLYDLKEIDLCFAVLEKMAKEYSGKRMGEVAEKQMERLKKKQKP